MPDPLLVVLHCGRYQAVRLVGGRTPCSGCRHEVPSAAAVWLVGDRPCRVARWGDEVILAGAGEGVGRG